jgi:hypothetical protein
MGFFPGGRSGWLGLGLALEDLFAGGFALLAGVWGWDLLCDGRRSERGQSDRAEKVAEEHCGFCCVGFVYAMRACKGNGGDYDGTDVVL